VAGGQLGTLPWRLGLALLGSLALMASLSATASAHIEVVPVEALVGDTLRYGIRVPSEKPIPTVRVEVQFPSNLRVMDLESVAGWRLSVQTDPTGRPVDAVWEGGSIPPNQFAEFGLRGRNPDGETELRWSVIQTYQDGSEVQWNGSPTAESPAATTRVVGRTITSGGDILGAIALVIALVAVGVAGLSWRTRRGGP
jgi:uncharacterized protein YcnI